MDRRHKLDSLTSYVTHARRPQDSGRGVDGVRTLFRTSRFCVRDEELDGASRIGRRPAAYNLL